MKLITRTNQPVEGDELENLNISGDLEVAGDTTIRGVLNVEDYELDKDITLTNLPTGLISTYAHSRVSNGKLNIVIALVKEANTSVSQTPAQVLIGNVEVGEDVYDKLYAYVSNVIATQSLIFAGGLNISNGYANIQVAKAVDNKSLDFYIGTGGIDSTTNPQYARYEFNFIL